MSLLRRFHTTRDRLALEPNPLQTAFRLTHEPENPGTAYKIEHSHVRAVHEAPGRDPWFQPSYCGGLAEFVRLCRSTKRHLPGSDASSEVRLDSSRSCPVGRQPSAAHDSHSSGTGGLCAPRKRHPCRNARPVAPCLNPRESLGGWVSRVAHTLGRHTQRQGMPATGSGSVVHKASHGVVSIGAIAHL